ncbi:MAG: HAD hydrolase-like protein [Bacteroidales bacterium]|jgi:phosphoglycolate phosphatase|nr:HAD hydrolase-like protein [Bacteroidales bacterium]
MNDKKLIVWDWNGTLLNDIDSCISSINTMLKRRDMKLLDRETYKKIFTFPVQDYYQSIGFNFADESFEQLSHEYIALYKEFALNASLQKGSKEILEQLYKKGVTQIILSASEQSSLEEQVNHFQIHPYFEALVGLNNIYAKSKRENAVRYLEDHDTSASETILIGDTYHDFEVAEAVGCDCLLVNNGHQNLLRHNLDRTIIIDSLVELQDYFSITE